MPNHNDINGRRNGAQGEQPATLGSLAIVVGVAIRVIMSRYRLVDVDYAHGVMVASQAMRGHYGVTEGK